MPRTNLVPPFRSSRFVMLSALIPDRHGAWSRSQVS